MKEVAIVILLIFSFSIFTGCAEMQHRQPGSQNSSNAGYCAAGGLIVGGLVGRNAGPKKNRTENTLLGAIAGAIGGELLCVVIENAARDAAIEAARTNRPVKYITPNGQEIRAIPSSSVYHTPEGNCQDITNEAWDTDRTYLGKVTRKVCDYGSGNLEVRT